MAASVEEFVELLSSEQHVDIARLRHLSRHGVHPAVRGEVWMYLLGVLSSDKSQEMTSVRTLYNTYDSLLSAQQRPNAFPSDLTTLIHREAERIWYTRVPWSYVTNNANTTTSTNEQQGQGSASYNSTDSNTAGDAQSNPQDWRRTRQGTFVSQNVLLKSHHASSGPSRPRTVRKLPVVQPMDLSHLVEAGANGRKGPAASTDEPLTEQKPQSLEEDHSPPPEASSPPPPPPPSAPPRSDLDRELATLKAHFIRRISNVVSVWIRKKALEKRDQMEADRLRDRLMQEASKGAQQDNLAEEEEEEGTISCGNSEDTHKGKSKDAQVGASPCAFVSSSSSSSSSASSSAPSPPVAIPASYSPAPPPASSTVARLEDAVGGVGELDDAHADVQDDDAEDRLPSSEDDESSSDTLLFDPAMGMGVDDAAVDDLDDELHHELQGLSVDEEGYAYHSHTRSHSHSHSHHRSRSRPHSQPHSAINSKRGTPRMGGTRDLIPDERDEEENSEEARIGLGLQNSQGLLSPQHREGSSYFESGIRRGGTLHTPPPYAGYRHSASPSRAHSPRPASPGSRSGPSSPRTHSMRGSPRRPLSRSGPKYVRHGQLDANSDEEEHNSPRAASSISSDSAQSESPHTPSDSDLELLEIQRSLWKPYLVELASPFVLVSGKRRVEAGIFFGFDKLMSLIEDYRKEYPLSHQLASFHSLLRRTLPDLRSYFDDEGLDVTPFVKGWLESLFSGQMKLTEGGCLRLWDSYFSTPTTSTSHPLSLHVYVCLAILLDSKDTLEELDKSECQSFLHTLPDLQVERILNEAMNLRLGHRQARARAGGGMRGRKRCDVDSLDLQWEFELAGDGVGLGDIGDVGDDSEVERDGGEDRERRESVDEDGGDDSGSGSEDGEAENGPYSDL